nr:hypothetical protein [Anaerolineae bacterium]
MKAQLTARIRRTYMRTWLAKPPKEPRIDASPGFKRWRARNQARHQHFITEYLRQWHCENPEPSRSWYENRPADLTILRQQHRA